MKRAKAELKVIKGLDKASKHKTQVILLEQQ